MKMRQSFVSNSSSSSFMVVRPLTFTQRCRRKILKWTGLSRLIYFWKERMHLRTCTCRYCGYQWKQHKSHSVGIYCGCRSDERAIGYYDDETLAYMKANDEALSKKMPKWGELPLERESSLSVWEYIEAEDKELSKWDFYDDHLEPDYDDH